MVFLRDTAMQTSKSLDISFLGRVDGLFAMPIELGAILDELALGIVILDRSRQVLFINKAVEAMTGFRRDEVRGVPCRYVLRTNICGRQCPLTQAAQDRASVTTEGNIINRDRKKIDVRLLAAPLYDPQGAMVGFVETVEDMTHVQGDVTPVPKTDGFNRIIGRSDKMRPEPAPDVILVPVCITSKEKESVLYHLELKNLELSNAKYTKAVAQIHRKTVRHLTSQVEVDEKAKTN